MSRMRPPTYHLELYMLRTLPMDLFLFPVTCDEKESTRAQSLFPPDLCTPFKRLFPGLANLCACRPIIVTHMHACALLPYDCASLLPPTDRFSIFL